MREDQEASAWIAFSCFVGIAVILAVAALWGR